MNIRFTDRSPIGAVKETQDGYLVATSRVARTGIQLYSAGQLGDAAKDLPADKIVRVYRDKSEVFSPESLISLTRVPVTLEHPPELVDSENWKTYAVGEVGDGYSQDGEWIVVNPMIKDAAAKEASKTTHKEISMGYTAEIVPARDGVDADFEQVNIRINHLALVPRGRAGSQARIGDADNWGASPATLEDKLMTVELKTVILGDKAVSVEAKDAATVAALLQDHKTIVDAKDEEIGELKAKLADAEAKVLSDEALDKLVNARVDAKAKRDAVIAKFGDKAVEGASDAEIAGMFKVMDKAVAPSKVADALRKGVADSVDPDVAIQDAINKRFNKEAK